MGIFSYRKPVMNAKVIEWLLGWLVEDQPTIDIGWEDGAACWKSTLPDADIGLIFKEVFYSADCFVIKA